MFYILIKLEYLKDVAENTCEISKQTEINSETPIVS